MTAIESRLAAVERQLRFHRLVTAGLLVAVVALVGYGATEGVPEVIRAKRFVATNDEGKTVFEAGADYNEHGGLVVFSKDGENPILWIQATSGGDGMLTVSNKEGKFIFETRADPNGGRLVIHAKDGTPAVSVGVGSQVGGGGLAILNANGEVAVVARADSSGGNLSVFNSTNDPRAFPRAVVQAFADRYGMGYLGVFDRQGKGRTLTPR
jgi:hypothetical protein